ncbi:MAG: hypothetical protein IPK22_04225 [Verrucomicrobiaceae bacterium]|nr:hypothetical protein [Verrucomicrobiaceae bacterium]
MNYDGVAISQDGVTWVEVSALRFLSSSYGTSATRVFLDPVIQRLGWSFNSTFQLRFSQYDDQAIANDGIGIDDVAVKANPTTSIAVNLPPAITEGTLNQSVTVTLPAAAASNTSVTLTSNAAARLSIASPVTILAGQTSASTTISAPQNVFADVGKGVIVTASATGQTTSYTHIRVVDDEQSVLTLALPASVTEGGSNGTGTVFIEPVQPVATTVFLISGNTAEATVSSISTISAGARSSTFTIAPVNDVRLDGTQTVSLTASGQGLVSASGSLDVLDNETVTLTITPPATLSEGGAPGVGTVALSGPRTVDTSITLVSSDNSEATVAGTVLIPAGQVSTNFQVFPVEDSVQDGTQSVTLTATAAGFFDGSASLQVQDNDPASFEWAIVPSPQTRNAPFAVTLTARDATDSTLTGFNGSVALSAHSGGASLPLSAASSGTFVNGVWSGNLAVGEASTSVTLLATGGDGATGTSDAFEVVTGGPAMALAFAPVTSPHPAGTAIPVQVSAVDAAGILVNETTGPVTVELVTSPGGAAVASASLTLVNGAASTSFYVPAGLAAVRLEGTAGSLTGQSGIFAIQSPAPISYPPPQVMFTDGFEDTTFKPEWTISGTGTHRTIITTANGPRTGTRHMTMDSTSDGSNARNEATLTLNLAGKSDVELSFWMKESGDEDSGPPTLPFTGGADFDGVAISSDGNTWYEVKGLRTADGISSTYTQFKVNLSAAATTHGLSLNSAFKIRFNHFDNFTYGSDGFAFDDITVTANAYTPPEPVATLFEDDFESGVFRPQWAITGTGNHRTQITNQQVPRGVYHLLMDVHTTGDSRNEASLTLDVTGHQDLTLKFWMKENNDEDQAPPTNPFTGGANFDGVAVSTDGNTWYEVQALRGTASNNTYQEFTVDLSAAATTFGFTPGADFRIRFNHFDNSSWVGGDGFAFDDIRVTGRPEQQLVLSAPATLAEGGSAMANVTLPAVRAVDTIITLATNRPGGLTVPATVTILAGNTVSADFAISVAQDAFLTGNLPLQVVATAEGFRRSVVEMAILDDETPAGFDLSLPATLAEGGTISGSVSMTSANLFDLSVALSASPVNGLTLPASVALPAGATSAAFDLTKAENDTILEASSTTVTASLGSGSDTAAVSLADNDASTPLVITLPASVLESAAPLTGSIGFAPPVIAGTDVTVTLVSSDTSELTLPATVVIPAGAGSVSFDITPVDDALSDGAVAVSLNASASGLTGDSHDISVLDDEVHHLAFDPISSPQLALGAFSITLRAESIDNQTVTNFTGTATLSAANAGGAVSMTPAGTGAFLNGVWSGAVTFPAPASAVTLTANAAGGLTGSSNSFDVIAGPTLAILPAALNVTTLQGEGSMSQALALSNPGTGSLNWNASIVGAAPWLSLSSSSGTIAQGGNANVTATFTPGVLVAGVYNATLRFTSNDPASPQQDVPVTFTLTAPVHHFDWSTIPSPQVANVPFAATLTAKDSAGNTLTGFNGSAQLRTLTNTDTTTIGVAAVASENIFRTNYADHRAQFIYSSTDVGGAGRIMSLAFNVFGIPPHSMTAFTIRLKHTSKASYSALGDREWESSGMTVVHQANVSVSATGWMTIPFSQPFDYNGTNNLLVDISFNNVAVPGTFDFGSVYFTTIGAGTIFASSNNLAGDPLTWSGTSPAPGYTSLTPNVRMVIQRLGDLQPNLASFTNGTWTGSVSVPSSQPAAQTLAIHATSPLVTGSSNAFAVTSTGSLSLSIPASGTEGGTLNGTLTASVAPASDLTVTFASSDTSEAVPSASATILAGQTSAAFTINLPEDALLDGAQAVVISATAPAYNRAQATTTVNDNETTTLTLTLPATLAEGTSSTTGQASVQLATQAAADLTISLSSSLTARLTVPASVVIPAGQSSAAFTLTAPNNSVIDGNQDAVITATLAGSTPATGTVQVTDNESRALSFILLTTSMREGGAANTTGGYITLAGSVPAPLTINLISSDTSELNVSSTVTINAGSFVSGYFTLTPVNDTALDGTQTATITASAASFTSATSSAISVLDDDAHHFTVSAVASPQVRNAPFNVTFTAKDINDVTITTYAGSPVLTAADGASPISVTPSTLTSFSSGVKTQSVSVGNDATNAVLTLTDPVTGGSSTSNAFAVSGGSLDHFGISPMPATVVTGIQVPVTITAQDIGNNTVTSFNQTAALSISSDSSQVIVGTSTFTWSIPLGSQSRSQRMQVIYLPSEVGAARTIHNLALFVDAVPGSPFTGYTIRMKHTSATSATASWDSAGWTTVYQANTTISSTGWRQFDFSTPFAYNGTSSLMIDFSYYNASTGVTQGYTRYTSSVTSRTTLLQTDTDYGNPLTWSGTTNPTPVTNFVLPNIRFGTVGVSVPVTPTVSGTFTNGVWSGNVSAADTASSVRLRAVNGATSGASNTFNVIAPPPLVVSLPATASESAGTVSGSVSFASAQATDTTISLSSSDLTEAEPATATVVIPAGMTSAAFTLNVIDDALQDGNQPVSITASSSGFTSGSASISVLDNDPHHFAISTISAQSKNVPFNVTVTAQNAANATLTGFVGTVSLSAQSAGSPFPITPGLSGAFVNGVWTGQITATQSTTNVTLGVTGPAGSTGTSNSFAVTSGPATRFVCTSQPAHVVPGTPFPVTLTAVDADGAPGVFSGSASVSVASPLSTTTTIGDGLFQSTVPLYTFQSDCRGQIIYKRSEAGPARRITGLALNISQSSTFVYNSFTLRLKHTSLSNFNASQNWETSGWTTVWQGNHTFNTTGWVVFTFTTPFDYNGVDNLMLDISTDNTTTGTGAWLRRDPTGYDIGMIFYYSQTSGAPTTWSGTSTPRFTAIERPQIRLVSDSGLSVTPATTGAFVNSQWTGNLTVNSTHPAVVLHASASGVFGASQPIVSGYSSPVLAAEPPFTGGTSNTLSWSASPGAGSHLLERDLLPSFSSPVITPGIAGTSSSQSGLQDGALYHYRVRGVAANDTPASFAEWQQTSYADFATATLSGTSRSLSVHDISLASSSSTPVTWTENFDAAGTSWAETVFPATGGGATMDRQAMTAGPNTTPALPVNQGSDLEGRIGSASGTSTGYAFMPATSTYTFADGSIEGYLAPEGITGFLYGSLLMRSSLSATGGIQGYAAFASFNNTSVTLSIQVLLNGILNPLGASSNSITLSSSDNVKLRLTTQGNTLTLQAWRVAVSGGVVVETPLVIDGGSTSMVRSDTTFSTGRPSVYFSAAAGRCYFDDITVTKNTPVFVSSGSVTSPVVSPAYRHQWGPLSYALDTSSPGSSGSIDVLDGAGNLLAAGVTSGTNLASLPAVASHTALRLRANLASSNSSSTPYLRDWSIGYVVSPAAKITSPWSNAVSSTQDATPPVITVPQLTTTAATATLAGTTTDATSGVVSVTAAGNAASTSNAFANWTSALTGLTDGTNSITVTAADNAVPPNTATTTVTVFRIATPGGDPENNGLDALLEHALGIPAGSANARSMLPAALTETDGGSGQKYLCMQFRRRIQRAGLNYIVETSTDLLTWDDTGASVVEKSAVPTGDGTTETVTVRVTPSIDLGGAKFVRLRVTSN